MQSERIFPVQKIAPASIGGTSLDQTLLCFVLVDPSSQHAFCSRYDFGPWPLLEGVETLPPHVMQVEPEVPMGTVLYDLLEPIAVVPFAQHLRLF